MRSGPKVRLLVFLDGIESIESRDGRIGGKAGLCCGSVLGLDWTWTIVKVGVSRAALLGLCEQC